MPALRQFLELRKLLYNPPYIEIKKKADGASKIVREDSPKEFFHLGQQPISDTVPEILGGLHTRVAVSTEKAKTIASVQESRFSNKPYVVPQFENCGEYNFANSTK